MTQPLYTNLSVNVQFAVMVTNVTLKDANSTPSFPLQVISDIPKTLTCSTSVSKPVSTVVWYIGTDEQQRSNSSTSFTFTPQTSDHNKQVYCKAFNTQPESQAVSSNKFTLDVNVQVTNVTLRDGNNISSDTLQVTADIPKTLTCTTSVSKPTATLVWYIGTVEKQRSSFCNNFTFTPKKRDHNKQIYCKAFNTQPESQAVSSDKATLFVRVLAVTPTILNQTSGNTVVLENEEVTLKYLSSQTRPAANITWKNGSITLTNSKSTTAVHSDGLSSVTSVITFTPKRSDKTIVIYCETSIPGQDNIAKARQNITVYWPPSTPVVSTTEFPFLEGQTEKSLNCQAIEYGNPSSVTLWDSKYGTQDSTDSRILNLPTLTPENNGSPVSCQLSNLFTQAKGIEVKSPTEKIKVEYTAIVHIIVDNTIVDSVTKNEGQDLTAVCHAKGNPTPNVSWMDQNSKSEYLVFGGISRNDNGLYTCRASASSTKYPDHNFVNETKLSVAVNYPPDVSVEINEAEIFENTSLRILCKASGRPSTYSYTSMVQTVRGTEIPNSHASVNGVITIQSLQLHDSGTYTCYVNNGIISKDGQLDQTGQTNIFVKGIPGGSVVITVTFYSYPDIRSVVFKRDKGVIVNNTTMHNMYYKNDIVTTKFYGKSVTVEGYTANLDMKYFESLFGNYTLVLDNGIGQPVEWKFQYLPQSIPFPLIQFNLDGLANGIPKFRMVRGFNGGLLQTFIVETSNTETGSWIEQDRFNETDHRFLQEDTSFVFNITGLQPGQYKARIIAGNKLGWIDHTESPTVQFIIPTTDEKVQEKETSLAYIVGGISAAVVVTVVSLAVVLLLRRKSSARRGIDKIELKECNTYECAIDTKESDLGNEYTSIADTGVKALSHFDHLNTEYQQQTTYTSLEKAQVYEDTSGTNPYESLKY